MLRNVHEIKSYDLGATDGDVGSIDDLFFDDQDWVIRYLVVKTGNWLSSRKVLISPYSLGVPDWEHKRLPINISRKQVQDSPDVDTDMPVSRQHETAYADYYSYPYYWQGSGLWGDGLYFPSLLAPDYMGVDSMAGVRTTADDDFVNAKVARLEAADPHLRSCKVVTGYQVHASDGELGHVSAMLVDESTWAIRYLVIDTSNWWMGNKVLVPPQWITDVNWSESKLNIDLTRETIKNSPRYESSADLNRQQENALYQHYGRPNYWEREHARQKS
jgi:hypothetical protein